MSTYGDRGASVSQELDKQRLLSKLVKFTEASIYSSGRKLQSYMYTIVYVAINRDVAKRSKRSKAGVHAIQALMPFMFIVSNMGAVSVRSVQSTVVLHCPFPFKINLAISYNLLSK